MQTPWGEVRVADAHAHFFSYPFFQSLIKALGDRLPAEGAYAALGKRLGWELPEQDPARLAERWVAEMDRRGVEAMVLMASVVGDEGSAGAAARVFPGRILGTFMLDPTAPDAPQRARRAFGELGLRGVALFPAMHHFHAWDDRVATVCAEAEAAGALVFVHFGILRVGVRDLLGLPSPFDLRFSNPLDLSGLARRFPKVPFQIPHFGCGYLREALILGAQCENVYVDTSSSNNWVKVLTHPLDLKGLFARALDVFGARRILFGTDSTFFPRGWREDIVAAQTQVLSALGVKREEAELIFGGNLRRLLGLEGSA